MAYNPNMNNTYGQMYGSGYGQAMYPQTFPQMQLQAYGQSMPVEGEIKWVDGEVGAKAFQLPQGMTKPVALWDTNDTVIYLKSMNQFGIPNPIQKIRYRMEDAQVPRPVEQGRLESGDTSPEAKPDMTGYIRRDELDAMKEELMNAIHSMQPTEAKGARVNGKSTV